MASDPAPTALTQERLLKTSSLDKDTSIKTFIQSQARYLSDYAVEGKKALNQWVGDSGVETDAKHATDSKTEKLKPSVGFSSPILKPRVPVKVDEKVDDEEEETRKRPNKENTEDKKTKRDSATMQKTGESRKKASSSGARKGKAACPSDDEHAKRTRLV